MNSQPSAAKTAQDSAQTSIQPQRAPTSQAPAGTGTPQAKPPERAGKEKPAEAQPSEAKPAPPAASESRRIEDAPRSNLAEPNTRAAAAGEMKSRIEKRLIEAGLGEKVHVRTVGDTFTLTGRLTPREHRQLLHLLRAAPAWIRLVDDIEYADAESSDASNDDRPRPAAGRGEIEVLTDVMGALAVLHGPQGRVLSNCTTPCRFEELWPGRYGLEVSLAGYRPVQRVLQVRAGSIVDAKIELEAMVAGLYVTTRPSDAQVFINGQRQPEPTPTTIRLGPGTYNILVRKPGFEPYAGQVQLKGDELTHLDVELAPGRQP